MSANLAELLNSKITQWTKVIWRGRGELKLNQQLFFGYMQVFVNTTSYSSNKDSGRENTELGKKFV
jgi:hypothetical protein